MYNKSITKKFCLILQQHEAISLLHEAIPLSHLLTNGILQTLNTSKLTIGKLLSRFSSIRQLHGFSNIDYCYKLNKHLSLLTGYYSIIRMYSDYSLLHQVSIAVKVYKSISELRINLERSIIEIDLLSFIEHVFEYPGESYNPEIAMYSIIQSLDKNDRYLLKSDNSHLTLNHSILLNTQTDIADKESRFFESKKQERQCSLDRIEIDPYETALVPVYRFRVEGNYFRVVI